MIVSLLIEHRGWCGRFQNVNSSSLVMLRPVLKLPTHPARWQINQTLIAFCGKPLKSLQNRVKLLNGPNPH